MPMVRATAGESTEKEAVDADGKTIRVGRQVEGGLEIFDLPLPAVASAQKGLNEPRYPR